MDSVALRVDMVLSEQRERVLDDKPPLLIGEADYRSVRTEASSRYLVPMPATKPLVRDGGLEGSTGRPG
jgi:hypothetical protein